MLHSERFPIWKVLHFRRLRSERWDCTADIGVKFSRQIPVIVIWSAKLLVHPMNKTSICATVAPIQILRHENVTTVAFFANLSRKTSLIQIFRSSFLRKHFGKNTNRRSSLLYVIRSSLDHTISLNAIAHTLNSNTHLYFVCQTFSMNEAIFVFGLFE
jgi:hypothetical protein